MHTQQPVSPHIDEGLTHDSSDEHVELEEDGEMENDEVDGELEEEGNELEEEEGEGEVEEGALWLSWSPITTQNITTPILINRSFKCLLVCES